MENTVKTNRLAIVSSVSGLITLLSLSAFFPLFFSATPGNWPGPASPAGILMNVARSLLDPGALVALLMGILALRDIKKKAGTEKGKTFAWIGIVIGGGWFLFRVLVAIYFILGMLFSLR